MVFHRQTPVSGFRPTDWRSLANNGLQVGPGGDFSEAILNLYASFVTSFPDSPPPGDVAVSVPAAAVLTSPAADAARDYVAPMKDKDRDRIEKTRDPEWDFHEYVSLLGHHPQLLRILGLAVELEVNLPANPVSVRVHTDYDNGADRRAVDFVMATTSDFWAKPNPDPKLTEQRGGFLRLAQQGAFLSIVDVLSSADRLRDLDKRLPGGPGSLPALRTRALTLVRPDLVTAFRNRTERQWAIEEEIDGALNTGQPVPIFAEDVTIGHRVDVTEPQAAGNVWRSLFERQADAAGYHFPRDKGLDVHPEPDEGWTTTTLVTELVETFEEPKDDVDDPFVPRAMRRLDDQLYRWDGWSGAVRPPGSAVDGTGAIAPAQPTVPPADSPVQFAATYEVVPGSLPRLRFSHQYLMRARCVDLSGDSRSLATVEPKSALPPVETFGRLEPIPAPLVVRRLPRPIPGVGDDALAIVLRSDYDVDDATVGAQERLMFPAQVGQDLCELHDQPKGGADPGSYALLATRDARDPDDPWQVDPVTGEPIAKRASTPTCPLPLRPARRPAAGVPPRREHRAPRPAQGQLAGGRRCPARGGGRPGADGDHARRRHRRAHCRRQGRHPHRRPQLRPRRGRCRAVRAVAPTRRRRSGCAAPGDRERRSLDVLATGTSSARPRRAPAVVGAASQRLARPSVRIIRRESRSRRPSRSSAVRPGG